MIPPTHEDVRAALARIAPFVTHTPMLRSAALDRITGGTIVLKPESLQRTGSFKFRGATNATQRLDPAVRARGVVAPSSGNHGQALACAAHGLGIPCTIVMPADAPRIKVENTRAWGATIIQYDRATDDRLAIAQSVVDRTGATLIPPFEHPDVIAGQGTLALELLADSGPLDFLLVCTGGGGMVAGCALAVEGTGTQVYAVEPAESDDTARSLLSGVRERNAPGGSLLCDALLTEQPGALTFSINQPRLAGGLVVTDAEVLNAMRFAFLELKLVIEPGGAVALAALLAGQIDVRGRRVGAVLSGGNVDPATSARALSDAPATHS